jgi:hypothetical protein
MAEDAGSCYGNTMSSLPPNAHDNNQRGDVQSRRRAPIMKAVEFQAQLNSDQTLTLPASVMGTIPLGQTVRVLILYSEPDADAQWEQLAAEDFGQGYADTDAIYDELSAR